MLDFFCNAPQANRPKLLGVALTEGKHTGEVGIFAWTRGVQIASLVFGMNDRTCKDLSGKPQSDELWGNPDHLTLTISEGEYLLIPDNVCEVKLHNGLEIVVVRGPRGNRYIVSLDYGSGCHLHFVRRQRLAAPEIDAQEPRLSEDRRFPTLASLLSYWTAALQGTFRSGPV